GFPWTGTRSTSERFLTRSNFRSPKVDPIMGAGPIPRQSESGENGRPMDFAWSAEQQTWHDAAVRFAREELDDDLPGREERREFWREGWRRCAAFGLQGLPVPVEYGGQGQ